MALGSGDQECSVLARTRRRRKRNQGIALDIPVPGVLRSAGFEPELPVGLREPDMRRSKRAVGSARLEDGDTAGLGYRLMICGSTIWLVYQQIRDAFAELKETGKVNPDRYGTRWDVAGLLGLEQIYELEREYGSSSIPVA